MKARFIYTAFDGSQIDTIVEHSVITGTKKWPEVDDVFEFAGNMWKILRVVYDHTNDASSKRKDYYRIIQIINISDSSRLYNPTAIEEILEKEKNLFEGEDFEEVKVVEKEEKVVEESTPTKKFALFLNRERSKLKNSRKL